MNCPFTPRTEEWFYAIDFPAGLDCKIFKKALEKSPKLIAVPALEGTYSVCTKRKKDTVLATLEVQAAKVTAILLPKTEENRVLMQKVDKMQGIDELLELLIISLSEKNKIKKQKGGFPAFFLRRLQKR